MCVVRGMKESVWRNNLLQKNTHARWESMHSSYFLYEDAILVDAQLVDTYERKANAKLRSQQRGKKHTLNESILVLV
jgi:hypothetical protein